MFGSSGLGWAWHGSRAHDFHNWKFFRVFVVFQSTLLLRKTSSAADLAPILRQFAVGKAFEHLHTIAHLLLIIKSEFIPHKSSPLRYIDHLNQFYFIAQKPRRLRDSNKCGMSDEYETEEDWMAIAQKDSQLSLVSWSWVVGEIGK